VSDPYFLVPIYEIRCRVPFPTKELRLRNSAILEIMSRRKLEDKNIRKLGKSGGKSISVTLPIDIIRELGWKSKQKVVVQRRGDTIVIKDWEG